MVQIVQAWRNKICGCNVVRDEVLVSLSTLFRNVYGSCVHSFYWDASIKGMHPRVLSRCIVWAKSHGSCSVEFEEQGEEVRVFLRTSDKDDSRRVCVATFDVYNGDSPQEDSTLGRLIDVPGPDVSVISNNGGSATLVEAFCEYLRSWYRQKLIDYPSFDLRLFNRCLKWTSSRVFGCLDGFAKPGFIINWMKSADTRGWMSSWPAPKKANLTNDLSMPHLVEFVANIIGVWPLIVSSLKETGWKDDGNSFVVNFSSFNFFKAISYPYILFLWCLEEWQGRTLLLGWNCAHEVSFAASLSWNLLVFPYSLLQIFKGT